MILFENVSKIYKGDVAALRDVSAEVQKGEFVFLVGPVRIGEVDVPPPPAPRGRCHRTVASSSRAVTSRACSHWKVPQLRRNIGCVFQDFKLLPTRTVYENVAFAMEVIGRPRHVIRTQVPQVLDLVGLAKKAARFPNELSGGEQQRVSIARAFVNRPLIVLADEPTGNLDPATTVGIMRILDRINRTGTTIVMATHDQRIVDAMRRRVIELDRAARPRPGTRRLRRRGLTTAHVDAHRVLLARDDGLAASQRAHDGCRHRDRRRVARAVRRDPVAVEVGRPRHRAHQGRCHARDLHEGRCATGSDRGGRGEAEGRSQRQDLRALRQADGVRGVPKHLPPEPRHRTRHHGRRPAGIVPRRAQERAELTKTVQGEFSTQQGVEQVDHAG